MPTMDTVKMDAAHWRELCQRIFTAWGAPVDIAACVADSLVDSNLAGSDHKHSAQQPKQLEI